ncbi:CoA-transferase family III [Phanerochaete sordida]|uniref:CoA-transferase family III n=1 Tax=Phanerochaete sordida TaxID=48140 RepID=A0A9P3GQH5_9APHY|nr:CoA-transferase family III [Phanerochaete sordida]
MGSKLAAEALWKANGLPASWLSRLHLTENPDPAVNSSFKLGSVAQTTIGLSGLSAAHFHQLNTGVEQNVSVDVRHAILEFKSELYYTVNGELFSSGELWDPLAGVYRTKDDSFVRIHTNFPHHRQGILDILGCAPTKDAVAAALLAWDSVAFEDAAAARSMCATALRTFEQWDAHPQGRALAGAPPVQLVKVGDAPKRVPDASRRRPLEGVRVLDLTRVLAGPVCGRTLAAHGADVLWVTSPYLPALPALDIDTSRGKRTTQLDLTDPADRATLRELLGGADVFLQAYRPGGLAAKGFAVRDVAAARPGIVYASLNAYGWDGPWRDRRGFDSLVQTATGFNAAEAAAYAAHSGEGGARPLPPRPFPMQAIDHAAGYLLAFGIHAALCRTITEGGSWEVRVSLAAVGQWIRSLGQLAPGVGFAGEPLPPCTLPQAPEVRPLLVELKRAAGDGPGGAEGGVMCAIKHSAVLDATPVREGDAPMRLDAHLPRWLPRP